MIRQFETFKDYDATPITLSLLDHNDLITNAPYYVRDDAAYFVLQHVHQFLAVVCETHIDAQGEPTELRVIFVTPFDTLLQASMSVDAQYKIDTEE